MALHGLCKGTHELDEVLGHVEVVLIDRVHDGVDQRLLVAGAQLRDVAEVAVGDAPVGQREDVARVRVAVEQPKLRDTSEGFETLL